MSDEPQPESQPVKCTTCVDTGYSPLAFWKEPCGACNGDSRPRP